MFYEHDFVVEVSSENNIVDVISEHVALKKKGNEYVGLCPFHNEKTPSFYVSEQNQVYHCFGCGKSGNIYTFLMEYENYAFDEAVEVLAKRIGKELPKVRQGAGFSEKRKEKNTLYEIHKEAATFYYYRLKSPMGKDAREYLAKRGLSENDMKRFGLGYADVYRDSLYKYLSGKGYSDAILKKSGLFIFDEKNGVYDKFWNRVMFPILDRKKNVIAFGGRVMGDSKPKYLNSPETDIFNKRKELYGLSMIKGKQKYIIVCEGYMDVISLHLAGFECAVASLGTAFTQEHATLLKRYNENIYLCYDSDRAGREAAVRAIRILREAGYSTKVINLTPYKDPDEFIKALSSEEFEKRIEEAKGGFLFEVDYLREKYDLNDPESKTKFVNSVGSLCVEFEDAIERDNHIEAFVREYNISKDSFMETVKRIAALKVGMEYERIKRERDYNDKKEADDEAKKKESTLLSLMFYDRRVYIKTKDIIDVDDFSNNLQKKVYSILKENDCKISISSLINNFEDANEQSDVANIFNDYKLDIGENGSIGKVVTELVKTIKQNRLLNLMSEETKKVDINEIIEKKKMLERLDIQL